jgi:hypothetical protein
VALATLHLASNVSSVKRKDPKEPVVVEVMAVEDSVAEDQETGLAPIRIVALATSHRGLNASNARRRDPKELAEVHHSEEEEAVAASEGEVGALGTGTVEATLHAKEIGTVQMTIVEQAILRPDLNVSNVTLQNQVAAVAVGLAEEEEVDVDLAAEEVEVVDAILGVAGGLEGPERVEALTAPLRLRIKRYPSMIRV